MDIWLENIGMIAVPKEYPKEDFETLAYLSKKYELVILTNWFIECQIKRLENIGICKFFTEFYGAEKYAKPYKESFEQAAGKFQMDEIAMVGDSLKMDIKGAIDAGIKNVVWRDIKNKAEEYKEKLEGVYVIKELKQLKDIF
jgi:HAD hydrolase, family IA, variant 1